MDMKSAKNGMVRKAFVMRVNPGCETEYEERHRSIWPELESTLKSHGVYNYSIFLDRETRELFAYVEFKDVAQWEAIAGTEACRRWWAHMKDIMPSHPDDSPVTHDLKEVFQIES